MRELHIDDYQLHAFARKGGLLHTTKDQFRRPFAAVSVQQTLRKAAAMKLSFVQSFTNRAWMLTCVTTLVVASPATRAQQGGTYPPPAKPAATATPGAAAPGATASAATEPPPVPDKPLLKKEELEQLLAPIALYPDSVLSQIFMASTYPVEIVQADRWAKKHKDLKGDALAKELEKQEWDASVKSLVNFPQVLAMMSEKLDLTIRLGDAVLAQQADVMNSVQVLRAKANANGNLKSNEQQKVTIVDAPPPDPTVIVQAAPPPQVITIESPSPSTIYVPTYSPTVVYGSWPYPAYPPAPYYPPGYIASSAISFGVGVAVGAAWGYAWGNCNWGGGNVDIDVDRNTNINNNIDRSKVKNEMNNRQTNRQNGGQNGARGQNGAGAQNAGGRGQNGGGRGQGSWQHNPSHRGGVPYGDRRTNDQFGKSDRARNQQRDQFRGRDGAGGPGGAGGRGGPGGRRRRWSRTWWCGRCGRHWRTGRSRWSRWPRGSG